MCTYMYKTNNICMNIFMYLCSPLSPSLPLSLSLSPPLSFSPYIYIYQQYISKYTYIYIYIHIFIFYILNYYLIFIEYGHEAKPSIV